MEAQDRTILSIRYIHGFVCLVALVIRKDGRYLLMIEPNVIPGIERE
jgi:hypothetical protein